MSDINPLTLGESIGPVDNRKYGAISFADYLEPLKKALEAVQREPKGAGDFGISVQACQELTLAFIELQKDEFCAFHVLYANTHRLVRYPRFKWEEGDNIITGGRIALIPRDLPFVPKQEELQGSKYPNHLIVWMCSPKSEVEYWEGIFLHKDGSGSPV